MSFENDAGVEPIGFLAGAAVTRRRFVKISAAMTVINTVAATDPAVGVALESASAAGVSVPVASYGIRQVEAGAAIAAGAQVTSDASGRAATVAAGNTSYGYAITAAAAAGEMVMVMLGLPNVNGPVN